MYKIITIKEASRLPNIWEIPLLFKMSFNKNMIFGLISIIFSPVLLLFTSIFTLLNYFGGYMKYKCPICNIPIADDCLCYECSKKYTKTVN